MHIHLVSETLWTGLPSQRNTERPMLQPGSSRGQSHWRWQRWSTGALVALGRQRVHSCTQQVWHAGWVSSYVRIIPLRARGWVRPSLGLCTSVGRRTGTMPWEWRNAGGRSRGMAGLPALTAWLLLSPTLALLAWLESTQIHPQAQDEQAAHSPAQTLGPSYPVSHVHKHSHSVCRLAFWMQKSWATLFSFSNFLLVKCWSCFFNLPDIEAITTSLSALSQHRKPIKTRKKHKLYSSGKAKAAFKLSATVLIHFSEFLALI